MIIRRNNKKYILMGLCVVVLAMSVAYAAFSTTLQINSTATISNTFCVGFDNTKTNTYTVTKGVSTGTTPTGTMSYSGTACSTKYVPNATVSSVFYQPGDIIEYTLTIANKSTFTAAIESILVDNVSVTSNQTITKGNIIYTVLMPINTTLPANSEVIMKVIAEFQNYTNITGTYNGESQTLSVGVNAVQDDGGGGFTPTSSTFTGYIYRYAFNTPLANKGSSAAQQNPYTIAGLTKGTDYITEDDYPTYSARATALDSQFYFKYDVLNDEIVNSYVCFIYNNSEHCMKGADSGASFSTNTGMIQDFQTYYNLGNSCTFQSSYSECSSNNPFGLYAASNGSVSVYKNQIFCDVNSSGWSHCYEQC